MLEAFSEDLRTNAIRSRETLPRAGQGRIFVIGASIAGTIIASVLARRFGPRVFLIAGSSPEPKRLIDGCSLRRTSVDAMAAGLGTSRELLWAALGGRAAEFDGLRIRSGPIEIAASEPEPIGLSTRHGHIVTVLRAAFCAEATLVEGRIDPNKPHLQDRLRVEFADGTAEWELSSDDLIFNTAPRALHPSALVEPPQRFVLAVQAPLRSTGASLRDGIAPAIDAPSGRQLAFLTPFADPMTPLATHYIINTAVVPASRVERERVLADLQDQMWACASKYGLDRVEEEATLGKAAIAIPERFDPVPSMEPRCVNLHAAFASGAPAVNVDGMLAQAIGALVFARSINVGRGVPASLRASARALREIRYWNRFNTFSFFALPRQVRDANVRMMRPLIGRLVHQWATLGAKALDPADN